MEAAERFERGSGESHAPGVHTQHGDGGREMGHGHESEHEHEEPHWSWWRPFYVPGYCVPLGSVGGHLTVLLIFAVPIGLVTIHVLRDAHLRRQFCMV